MKRMTDLLQHLYYTYFSHKENKQVHGKDKTSEKGLTYDSREENLLITGSQERPRGR